MLNWIALIIVSLSIQPAVAVTAVGVSLFNQGEHCVAYRTKKNFLIFVKTVEVVGRNCEISTQILPLVGGKYQVEVTIPADGFKSGEAERDRDVAKLLNANGQSTLTFRTEALSKEDWEKLFAKGEFEIPGELQIGDKSHALKVGVKVARTTDGVEVDGVVNSHFHDMGLEPPKLAFGLMAKVKEDLELHFHLLGSKTLGINSLF